MVCAHSKCICSDFSAKPLSTAAAAAAAAATTTVQDVLMRHVSPTALLQHNELAMSSSAVA